MRGWLESDTRMRVPRKKKRAPSRRRIKNLTCDSRGNSAHLIRRAENNARDNAAKSDDRAAPPRINLSCRGIFFGAATSDRTRFNVGKVSGGVIHPDDGPNLLRPEIIRAYK